MRVERGRRLGGALALATFLVAAAVAPATAGRATNAARRHTLKHGRVVGRVANDLRGANPSLVVEVEDGVRPPLRALFKSSSGQRSGAGGVRASRMYLREAAVSHLADDLGLADHVPPTTRRVLDGEIGSIQLWAEGATRAKDHEGLEVERGALERLRVFDYLIGNSDRSIKNLLVRTDGGRARPIGIDHGNSLPTTAMGHFFWPYRLSRRQTGPLLAETRAFIVSIDPDRVTARLHASGIERDAVTLALRRLERMRRDPRFLEIPDHEELLEGKTTLHAVSAAGRDATQGLSTAARARIEAIVARHYGPSVPRER